jgi:hypothetical protein
MKPPSTAQHSTAQHSTAQHSNNKRLFSNVKWNLNRYSVILTCATCDEA